MSQTDRDPASDLLYSNNFALHALNEAATATADPSLHAAARRLRDFMVRVQVVVRGQGFEDEDVQRAVRLNGTWLRSFDFQRSVRSCECLCKGAIIYGSRMCTACSPTPMNRWEPYAQASDSAWGPWVAETGHGMSLITLTLAVMERNTSMWTVTTGSVRRKQRFAAIASELIPQYFGNQTVG